MGGNESVERNDSRDALGMPGGVKVRELDAAAEAGDEEFVAAGVFADEFPGRIDVRFEQLIGPARQLREMGYDSSSGALTMMPSGTELIVSYEDMWTWDFNTYMIEIDMAVRSARTDKILAVGHYNRPSMVFGRPPTSMIHDLLVKLFKHS